MTDGCLPGGCVVVHLSTETGMRGGEVQALGLMERLERAGVQCILAAPPGAPLAQRAREAGVSVVPWKSLSELDPLSAYRLRSILRSSGARFVHAHTAHALTPALMARAAGARVKVIASRRVSFPLRGVLSGRKYRSADAVVAVSGEIRDGLVSRGVASERVKVIHSGVDLTRFFHLPSREEARALFGILGEGPVVGCVGALVGHKGQDVLLEAMASFGAGTSELVLAGEGRERGALAKRAESSGVNLRFLGYVQEPATLYRAFDCLVLPSRSGEGSPGVIKEAAAAGVPVVATNVGGTSEILRDGMEALLVPPDDVAALASALRSALDDRTMSARLAGAAHQRIQSFSMDRMAEGHLALYADLLKS